jgi:hypothetical protein
MKKAILLLATLLLCSVGFTDCRHHVDPTQKPEPIGPEIYNP